MAEWMPKTSPRDVCAFLNLRPVCPARLTAQAGSKKSAGVNLQENLNERRIKLFSSSVFNLLQR